MAFGHQAGSGTAELKHALPQQIPAPRNNLDAMWTGPGGVGDYARVNGNTPGVVNAAHTFPAGLLTEFEWQQLTGTDLQMLEI